MSGNMFWDMVIWFFAISGLMLMLCDCARYWMYKGTLPTQMTLITSTEAIQKSNRASISNLINTLYDKNPNAQYEILIVDNTCDPVLKRDLQKIVDATDCVFVANAENIGEYIKQSFQ